MDEKDSATQSQSSEPVETSKWVWLVGFGYIVFLAWCCKIIVSFKPLFAASDPLLLWVSAIFIIAGLIPGVFALIYIALHRGQIQGTRKAVTAIVLSSIYIFLASGIIIPTITRERIIAHRMTCGSNLAGLGKALMIYADEHGTYPPPYKWCDTLLQGKYVTEDIFKCPGNKKARCSYSINPNCEPNSPPDVILVFESKSGWNSYGKPELFTAEHHTNNGGNILYNDGHVMFECVDPNGQLYDGINWGEKGKGRDSN